jgi:hypothetical protein
LPSYIEFSIGAIRVEDVQISMTSPGNISFELKVEHVPEDDNYGHSEIRTYKNGAQLGKDERKKINQPTRLEIKQKIAEKIVVVLPRP